MDAYTLESGRCVCRNGKPFATIHRVTSGGPDSPSPTDVDAFARLAALAPRLRDALDAILPYAARQAAGTFDGGPKIRAARAVLADLESRERNAMEQTDPPVLSPFVRSALGALLWSDTDEDGEPFDGSEGARYETGSDVPLPPEGFDPEGLAEFARECASFWEEVIENGLSELMPEPSYAHDFILSRNGHGTGFWDRGLGLPGEDLHLMAKAYGTVGLYRGDDGRIYFHG